MLTVHGLLVKAEQAAMKRYYVCDKRTVAAVAVLNGAKPDNFIAAVNGLVVTKGEYRFNENPELKDQATSCCPLKKDKEKTCMALHAEQLVAMRLMIGSPRPDVEFVVSSGCPCVTCLKWLHLAGVRSVLFCYNPIADSIQFAQYLHNFQLMQVNPDTIIIGKEGRVMAVNVDLQTRQGV